MAAVFEVQSSERSMANYSVLLVAVLIVLSVPVLTLFILAPLVRASRANKVKLEPYECGIAPTSLAFDHRFSVRYFLIAVLFIVFDVETVFLFPWAIRFKQLGWFGAIEMAIFLAILLIGYFYAWKRKVLSWV
jgi:NADH-quinone oxidoreductase subunit A